MFDATEYSESEFAAETLTMVVGFFAATFSGEAIFAKSYIRQLQWTVCLFEFIIDGEIKESSANALNN